MLLVLTLLYLVYYTVGTSITQRSNFISFVYKQQDFLHTIESHTDRSTEYDTKLNDGFVNYDLTSNDLSISNTRKAKQISTESVYKPPNKYSEKTLLPTEDRMVTKSHGYHTTKNIKYRDQSIEIKPSPNDELDGRLNNGLDARLKQSIRNPVSHIAFEKVHKAASSTVQNILIRYVTKHNLTIVAPKENGTTICKRCTVNQGNILPPPVNKSFDVLCNHVRYNRKAFERILPKDTVYIASLREPYSQFTSALNYYYYNWKDEIKFLQKLPKKNGLLSYLENPESWHGKWTMRTIPLTFNRMALDMGFPDDLFKQYNHSRAHEYILQLDRDFKLVIIVKYFVESIVFMRRMFDWDVKDILFVKTNVGNEVAEFLENSGAREELLFRNLSKLDYQLYEYFLNKMENQIKQQNDNFHEEVKHFKQLLRQVELYCKLYLHKKNLFLKLKVKRTKWNKRFYVTKQDCEELTMDEIKLMNKVITKQYSHQFLNHH